MVGSLQYPINENMQDRSDCVFAADIVGQH